MSNNNEESSKLKYEIKDIQGDTEREAFEDELRKKYNKNDISYILM